jgi:imidazolonepropionase-like amidohydrolase
MKTLLIILLSLSVAARAYGDEPEKALIIQNVCVIDTEHGTLKPNCRVVIRGKKILSVEPVAAGDQNAEGQVIDGKGKFLIPGLWDMHVHLPAKEFLTLFVVNGVTGVRDMHGFFPERILQWRQQTENGSALGPHIVAAAALIDGEKPFWPGSVVAKNAEEGREAVRSLKKRGADFIKVYSKLTPEAYFAIADETKKQGMVFAGHVPESVSAAEASAAGQKSMEHLYGILVACSDQQAALRKEVMDVMAKGDNLLLRGAMSRAQEKALDSYNPTKAATLFAAFAKNGTWQVPTLVVLRNIASMDDPAITQDARLKYFSPFVRGFWEPKAPVNAGRLTSEIMARLKRIYRRDVELVRALHEAGVPILAGTDTTNPFCFPGFSLHDELGLLVGAGLSPAEALRSATFDAARFLGKLNDYGSVTAGKRADLVLLDASPLEDIHNTTKIRAVVLGGKVLDRAELDRHLAELEAAAKKK